MPIADLPGTALLSQRRCSCNRRCLQILQRQPGPFVMRRATKHSTHAEQRRNVHPLPPGLLFWGPVDWVVASRRCSLVEFFQKRASSAASS